MSSTRARTSNSRAVASRNKTFRPDIQGLRAVAVIVVVFDHMLRWPSGGFVGVDVFFVISGFLITGLLLREHEKTGTVSFIGFYRGRLRRIAPAATVVLLAVVITAYVVFTKVRFAQTFWDAIWAFWFSANWNFATSGTDYFQAGLAVSPLQHFWSLAVEEQFYFVWPWLMLLIFLMVGKRNGTPQRARRSVGVAMVGIVVTSFAWALWETETAATWAYFSTFSRAWELGVGALVAVFSASLLRIPDRVRPVLAWVGIGAIAASLFLVTDEVAFPAPWAALPVLATALVIVAGTGGGQRYIWPLTNPVSVWFGNLSYSLYLWHWPVIVFIGVLIANPPTQLIVTIVAILGFSAASYYAVEKPIRNSNWLVPKADRLARRRRGRAAASGGAQTSQLVILGAVAVVSVSLVALALVPRPVSVTAAPPEQPQTAVATDAPVETPAKLLAGTVASSLAATEWPTLQPSLDQLGEGAWAPEIVEDGCLTVDDANLGACRFGSGDKVAVLLGDSVAASWIPAIRAALEPQGYQLQVLTRSGCPFFDVTLRNETGEKCDLHRAWAAEKANEIAPDLTLVSNAYEDNVQEGDNPAVSTKVNTWKDAGIRSFAALGSGTPVVLLSAPPGGKDPNECVTIVSKPSDCVSTVSDFYRAIEAAGAEAATSSVDDSRLYVNTTGWFCSNGKCPLFVGTVPVRIDVAHLTGAYSASLGSVFADAVSAVTSPPVP